MVLKMPMIRRLRNSSAMAENKSTRIKGGIERLDSVTRRPTYLMGRGPFTVSLCCGAGGNLASLGVYALWWLGRWKRHKKRHPQEGRTVDEDVLNQI